MHHSSTSTYIKIEETFCARTDGHFRHMLFGRLGGVDLNMRRERYIFACVQLVLRDGRMTLNISAVNRQLNVGGQLNDGAWHYVRLLVQDGSVTRLFLWTN